jgi:hypothetical protein
MTYPMSSSYFVAPMLTFFLLKSIIITVIKNDKSVHSGSKLEKHIMGPEGPITP